MDKKGIYKNNKKIYRAWASMRDRCNNENCRDYPKYGGVGITVCDEWNENSVTFVEWSLKNGYKDGLKLCRKDAEKDYSPDNCFWGKTESIVRNRRILKTNKTGVTGVCYEVDRNKYKASIYVNNKQINLGRYDTLEEAKEAREKAKSEYWGDKK